MEKTKGNIKSKKAQNKKAISERQSIKKKAEKK